MTRPAATALGCLLATVGCAQAAAPHAAHPTLRPACRPRCDAVTARVVRIVDGDTLVLSARGRRERVRLIGVDAPETWLRHDCLGAAATRALSRLTPPGTVVRTAGDADPRDRYGRRLLYLWTPRGVLVNASLVRTGFARAMAVPPDTSHETVLRAAEDAARRARVGLWQPALAGCGLARRSRGPGVAARP